MKKGNQKIISFYEDSKSLKHVYFILTILFYIGFFFGMCSIVLYRFISPSVLLGYYQPSGEDIIVTIVCLLFAIIFTVIIKKLNRFNYYIKITENEIEFIFKERIIMYKEFTLREYKIFRKYFFYKEFLLLFKDKEKIKITTRKAKELTQILDELISRRSEKEDQ